MMTTQKTNVLYKYCPPDRWSVLEDLLLRFTPLGALNDPVEGRFVVGPHPAESARAVEDDYEAEWAQVEVFLSTRMAALGVLCLSRNPVNMAMWTHYASEGRGFLLGIDADKRPLYGRAFIWSEYRTPKDLTAVPGFGSFRAVEYRAEPYCIDFGGNVPWDAFFAKGLEWSSEEEVRIFRSLADADVVEPGSPYDIRLFRVPLDAVAEVILGWQADDRVIAAAEMLRAREDTSHIAFEAVDVDHRGKALRRMPWPRD